MDGVLKERFGLNLNFREFSRKKGCILHSDRIDLLKKGESAAVIKTGSMQYCFQSENEEPLFQTENPVLKTGFSVWKQNGYEQKREIMAFHFPISN